MQQKWLFAFKAYTHMAAVALVTKIARMLRVKRDARNNGNPVIAFLAELSDVSISHIIQWAWRKLALWTFGFLQTQDIWLCLIQKALHQADAKANRVDVPSGNLKAHTKQMAWALNRSKDRIEKLKLNFAFPQDGQFFRWRVWDQTCHPFQC